MSKDSEVNNPYMIYHEDNPNVMPYNLAKKFSDPAEPDLVNNPPHYASHPTGVECIDIAECYGFNVGNAIKYLWRAGLKTPDPMQDLRKAQWYVTREIDRLDRLNRMNKVKP